METKQIFKDDTASAMSEFRRKLYEDCLRQFLGSPQVLANRGVNPRSQSEAVYILLNLVKADIERDNLALVKAAQAILAIKPDQDAIKVTGKQLQDAKEENATHKRGEEGELSSS